MVQRRAARYILNRYHNVSLTSVSDMISQLGWDTLETRRKHHRLTMFYKIHNGLVDTDMHQYRTPAARESRLYYNHSSSDYHMNSFFPKTVWNGIFYHTTLPQRQRWTRSEPSWPSSKMVKAVLIHCMCK